MGRAKLGLVPTAKLNVMALIMAPLILMLRISFLIDLPINIIKFMVNYDMVNNNDDSSVDLDRELPS